MQWKRIDLPVLLPKAQADKGNMYFEIKQTSQKKKK